LTPKEHEEARRMCEMVVHDDSDYVWMAKVLATAYLDLVEVFGVHAVQDAVVRRSDRLIAQGSPYVAVQSQQPAKFDS
jgi:hypothetical protein